MGLPEAVRSVGGSWLQMVQFGAIPQGLQHYVSYVLYAFELNVRASMVLGLGCVTQYSALPSFREGARAELFRGSLRPHERVRV
jgi:hypothetical protein